MFLREWTRGLFHEGGCEVFLQKRVRSFLTRENGVLAREDVMGVLTREDERIVSQERM